MLRWLLAVVLVLPLAARNARVLAGDDPAAPSASTPPAAAESAAKSPASGADDEKDADKDADKKADEKKADDKEAEAEDKAEKKAESSDKKDSESANDEKKSKDDDQSGESKSKEATTKSDEGKPEKAGEAPKAGDDKKESGDKKPAEEKKPETVKVKKKDLKIQVEAEGVFVAEEAEEVALRPEVWTAFKVVEAVPHGKRVHKGDVLVKFDDKDIEEAIAEKSLQQRLGEVALMAAEEEFPRLEKSIDLNYDQAQREFDQAKDEQERFQKTMRELSEKMAKYYLQSAEQDFDNAKEELDQLQKMYAADEITEETEEIVLRRQKFQVEAAKFFLEYSKINHDFTVDVAIPRREESLATAVEQSKIEFERAKMAKSLGLNQQRFELASLRETRARSVENHAKLLADRALMTLKAPMDGIAYYGRCVNGRWNEVSSLESKLIPFGQLTPNSVVMTVVNDRPMYVETAIGEKELPEVKDDQPVVVSPAADAELELKGTVKTVADVPGSGNKFTVRLEMKLDDAPGWLMPGMTGKAKITTYDVKDAVVIAADLVQTDEDDPKTKYVMIQVEDEEKPVRREIKLGKTKDKEVEVLKGLSEGDQIVKGAKDAKDEDKAQEEKK